MSEIAPYSAVERYVLHPIRKAKICDFLLTRKLIQIIFNSKIFIIGNTKL